MGVENLIFQQTSSGETIYDPEQILSAVSKEITILNLGTEDLESLGLYVNPSLLVGDVDYPADEPPESDYQDLLTWGEDTQEGVTGQGGMKLTIPQNSGDSTTTYITRKAGYNFDTKLPMKDLAAGESAVVTIDIETPPSVSARRIYISLVVDQD